MSVGFGGLRLVNVGLGKGKEGYFRSRDERRTDEQPKKHDKLYDKYAVCE